jgi:release factor glutamine methyltransferase
MVFKTDLQPATVASILGEGKDLLARHGVETACLDAERLIAHCLKTTRLDLYKRMTQTLINSQEQLIRSVFERRVKREPLQYIIGDEEFWTGDFIVTPGVFIPRPETEGLIQEAIDWFDLQQDEKEPATILDLCTGSGCIAITLAKHAPSFSFYALDCSSRALEIARANAQRHGLNERITFLYGDLFEPLATLGLERRVDLIVSNPPYIPSGLIKDLQPEVSLYEPREALDGGPDGLEIVRRIIVQAPSYLSSRGKLLLEIGDQQAVPLTQWFQEKFPDAHLEFRFDLAGIQRVACIDFAEFGASGHRIAMT